ncbi:hypothetical protein [Facilibium subflavum]|uniref:hypothetical protein n=1 Tax=Facilibium subflavum TaxID=2219058 RepID=UPI000E64C2E9|nr:hypothetical protein [Facilibium subflavum]
MQIKEKIIDFMEQYHNPVLIRLIINLIKLENDKLESMESITSQIMIFLRVCYQIEYTDEVAKQVSNMLSAMPVVFVYYFLQSVNQNNPQFSTAMIRYLSDNKEYESLMCNYMAIEKAIIMSDILSIQALECVKEIFED